MNRLYKLAWSPRTRSMVAVSELAKGRKKGTTLRGAIAAIVIGLTCGTASAARDTSMETCGENADESALCMPASSGKSRSFVAPMTATPSSGLGISYSAEGAGITTAVAAGDIAFGPDTLAGYDSTITTGYAIAFGTRSRADHANTLAIGAHARATAENATVVAGNASADYFSTASADNTLILGSNSSASAENSTVLGAASLASNTATNSVVIGNNITATRADTVFLGNGTTAWQIANMSAGTALNDAVNISQLLPVVDALGGGASFNPTDGTITAPSYSAQGSTDLNIGQAFTTLDTASSNNAADIATLTEQFTGGGLGLVQQAAAGNLTVGAGNDGTTVDFTGTAGTRTLTGVSAGVLTTTSTDAVNGSQLNDTTLLLNARTDLMDSIENSITGITSQLDTIQAGINNVVAYDDASNGQITLGGGANGTRITNVADGAIETGSMDAINGGQLASMRDSFQNLIGGLDDQVGAIEDSLKPIVDTDMRGSVVSNVGNATSNTDLANIGQMNEYMQAAVDQAVSYTDAQIGTVQQSLDKLQDDVNNRFNKQDKRISRLGAMSAASNMMAFATQGIQTRNRGGVGVGTQNGFSAMSVGYSRALSENMNVSVSGTTSGSDTSAGVGFGMNW
jgi:trimeric autotransporter adhesin